MINGKKVVVVLPAFRAAKTLEKTYKELPKDLVDDIILVDDASDDETVKISKRLGIKTVVHDINLGYGANQKTCYREALRNGADIIIMLHPDYQYQPKLVPAMAMMIAYGDYDLVLGSRILVNGALKGGMPLYKYISNRVLTLVENILLRHKLSEYHTGYRAFSGKVLETLPLGENTNGFVFDNEILAQSIYFGFSVGEISCPARYFSEASSIHFLSSVSYGFGVLWTALKYVIEKSGLWHFPIFNPRGKRITPS